MVGKAYRRCKYFWLWTRYIVNTAIVAVSTILGIAFVVLLINGWFRTAGFFEWTVTYLGSFWLLSFVGFLRFVFAQLDAFSKCLQRSRIPSAMSPPGRGENQPLLASDWEFRDTKWSSNVELMRQSALEFREVFYTAGASMSGKCSCSIPWTLIEVNMNTMWKVREKRIHFIRSTGALWCCVFYTLLLWCVLHLVRVVLAVERWALPDLIDLWSMMPSSNLWATWISWLTYCSQTWGWGRMTGKAERDERRVDK